MANTKQKFLFVSHSPNFHGGEICLLETITSVLKFSDAEAHVIIPANIHLGKLKLETELEKAGAIIHYMANPLWLGAEITLKQKKELYKRSRQIHQQFLVLLDKIQPDVVVISTIASNPLFALGARSKGIKVIWYIQELGDKDHKLHFYLGKWLTFKIISHLSDKVLFNSVFTFNHFVKNTSLPDKKYGIIDYAVSYTIDQSVTKAGSYNIDKKSDWKLLIAGRTVEGKGQVDSVKAMHVLVNEYGIKQVHLTVLGQTSNDYSTQLLDFCKENHLDKFIDFVPFTENVTTYFKEADIGITCSRNEAFGRITVEYMKYGLLTIGANAGGTAEIIKDKTTGFLYEVGNYRNLANVVREVIDTSHAKLSVMQQNAITYSNQRFSLENHYAQFIKQLN